MSFFAGTKAAVWGVELEMTTRVTNVNVTNRLDFNGEYGMVFASSKVKTNFIYFQSSPQITGFRHTKITISLWKEISDGMVYDGTVFDMKIYDMVWCDVWYDVIWCDVIG